MAHDLTRQAPGSSTHAGAEPVQRSSESLRGNLRGRAMEAQDAMLTPVQRRQAIGARPSPEALPVQMHVASERTRNIQRLEGDDNANASATPHADAALEHVRGNGVDGASGAENAPVITVPQTYDTYVAHIKQTFAAELAEIRLMKEQQKAKGRDAQAKEATLTLEATELNWYRHELETLGRSVQELTTVQQTRHQTLEAIKGYQGMTMEEMHAKMTELIAKYEGKLGKLSGAERAEIESLMFASIELGGQVDSETSSKVRLLYLDKIDNQENQRLVGVAQGEQMAPDKLAELGVKYRTWSKTFVRTELMDNTQAAEILFMRDLGADGNQVGVTPATLAEKLFGRAQEKANVPRDERIPFSQADQQAQLKIYKDMLEAAKKTNPNVNAALTAPRESRPLDLPDDQPSPVAGAQANAQASGTPNGNGT